MNQHANNRNAKSASGIDENQSMAKRLLRCLLAAVLLSGACSVSAQPDGQRSSATWRGTNDWAAVEITDDGGVTPLLGGTIDLGSGPNTIRPGAFDYARNVFCSSFIDEARQYQLEIKYLESDGDAKAYAEITGHGSIEFYKVMDTAQTVIPLIHEIKTLAIVWCSLVGVIGIVNTVLLVLIATRLKR